MCRAAGQLLVITAPVIAGKQRHMKQNRRYPAISASTGSLDGERLFTATVLQYYFFSKNIPPGKLPACHRARRCFFPKHGSYSCRPLAAALCRLLPGPLTRVILSFLSICYGVF